ncbi:MAG: sulfotransferase [Deltaproteobacteria bacterium]|nr:sulfotransferase [Deltaproteobacteria bacterium]
MIRGFLEYVSPAQVIGWTLDDHDLNAPITIRVLLGNQLLGQCERTIFRPDLGEFGAGLHGFVLEFSSPLMEGELAEVVVEAARTGSTEWCPLPRLQPTEMQSASLQRASPAFDTHWSDDPIRARLTDEDCFPVFVTGSVRSGTSAVAWALMRATRYKGFAEGHVIDMAAALIAAVQSHLDEKHRFLPAASVVDFHLMRYPVTRVDAEVQRLLRRLAGGFTTPFWIDKTPSHEMILSIPIVARAWPNARFIFMKRRGLENVISQLRKFPADSFDRDCRRWADVMADWRKIRSAVPGKFVELEQRTLLHDPDGSALRVGTLLELPAIEVEALGEQLRILRPETTDPSAHVVSDVAETGWSSEMIETFHRICGPEMEAYGYTYDVRYSQ